MLSTRLKAAIRNTYRQIADGLPGFVPRKEQNFLVAEIAKTCITNIARQFRNDPGVAGVLAGN